MFVELSILFVMVGFLLYRSTVMPAQMPPGTYGWPLIGLLPSRSSPILEYFRKLKKKYGNMFTVKWGSRTVVCLADPHTIKKVLNHPDIQGRPDLYSFQAFFTVDMGIILSSDNVWKTNRRFLLQNLRDLGMGKSHIEDSINREVEMLVNTFETRFVGKTCAIDMAVNVSVLNIIWAMLAGKRYEADDPKMLHYNQMMSEVVDIMQGSVFFIDVFPWILSVIPMFLVNKLTGMDKVIKSRKLFHELCREIIEEHKKELDPDNPIDIIDHYLLEVEANKEDPDTIFRADCEDLVVTMTDLFAAGSETTSNSIRWIILYMAIKPEVQSKIQSLLDEVVPSGRLPSLEDRDKLAYFEAVLLEIQRFNTLTPTGMPHTPSTNVRIDGYVIPKDTMILPCIEVCHRDPDHWEKPDQFYPEHFLDKDGKLEGKKDAYLPFSMGRRQCLGEGLARMEVFLFASAILYKFVISPPPGETISPLTNPSHKTLQAPLPFKVVMTKRK